MEEPFALPRLEGEADDDGWTTEVLRYQVRPRPKPQFRTVLDARQLFTDGGLAEAEVTTRTREPVPGQTALELDVQMRLGSVHMRDQMKCLWRGGLVSEHLDRKVGEGRKKDIDFVQSPFALPSTTYPEVLIPFLMRGQPRDGARRSLYAWTSDRFVARVYYESRKTKRLSVPAGEFAATEVWMYPDLNDWVAMGTVLTRLAKPLLPRYEMFFEAAAPHRLVRFEGSFGPPGAPEMIIELSS